MAEKGVYRKIAEAALVEWYKYSKEDAKITSETSEIDWLESGQDDSKGFYGVGGKNSIRAGISTLIKELSSNMNVEEVLDGVYHDNDERLGELGTLKTDSIDTNKIILEALKNIHNIWCIDNVKKFFRANRNMQFQHLPIELIGWEEAKKDLLFLKPILEKMGVEFSEELLKQAYELMKKDFLIKENIKDEASLREYIQKGEYARQLADSLEDGNDQKEMLLKVSDSLKENGSVEENGLGVVDKILEQFKDKKRTIDYPKSGLAAVRDAVDLSKNQNQSI